MRAAEAVRTSRKGWNELWGREGTCPQISMQWGKTRVLPRHFPTVRAPPPSFQYLVPPLPVGKLAHGGRTGRTTIIARKTRGGWFIAFLLVVFQRAVERCRWFGFTARAASCPGVSWSDARATRGRPARAAVGGPPPTRSRSASPPPDAAGRRRSARPRARTGRACEPRGATRPSRGRCCCCYGTRRR